jgi:hypothetical protein
MSHDDFDFEPVRGLPAMLPAGETLLWQGAPDWKSLAIRAYHVRKVAIYFALLIVWRLAVGFHADHDWSAMGVSCLLLVTMGSIAIGVLALLAYLNARSTVYSITTQRVLMRHGVAVPLTMNIPLKHIDGASLKSFVNGTGDLSLALPKKQRIGYLISWPHLRPGKYAYPEPTLRAIGQPAVAADMLARALQGDPNIEPALASLGRTASGLGGRGAAVPGAATPGVTTPGVTTSASTRPRTSAGSQSPAAA